MKLKKFAAMMLAGVMAVSMLAGCSGKGTNGGNNGGNTVVEPSDSSVVAAFNDKQSKSNKVKVEFSADADLDAALAKAVEAVGIEHWNKGIVEYIIAAQTGINEGDSNTFFDANDQDNLKNGATHTSLVVKKFGSEKVWSEAAAVNSIMNDVNATIAGLDEDTYKDSVTKDKYFKYEYEGTASLVSVEKANGAKVYYIAYTITQTAVETPVKA